MLVIKPRYALLAALAAAATLGSCAKPHILPATSSAAADPANAGGAIGAFSGDWSGHDGEVVIDVSGHGVKTVRQDWQDPGTKTTFYITEVRRANDRIEAEYSTDSTTGTLTFYCAQQAPGPVRGDLDMDSWPLMYSAPGDPSSAKSAEVVNAKRAQYCTSP